MIAGLALAWLAGVLSVLSPCVLPILPVVLGAAAAQSRLGPAALAGVRPDSGIPSGPYWIPGAGGPGGSVPWPYCAVP